MSIFGNASFIISLNSVLSILPSGCSWRNVEHCVRTSFSSIPLDWEISLTNSSVSSSLPLLLPMLFQSKSAGRLSSHCLVSPM